jgi:hypothetical protein
VVVGQSHNRPSPPGDGSLLSPGRDARLRAAAGALVVTVIEAGYRLEPGVLEAVRFIRSSSGIVCVVDIQLSDL